jgi:hypothetical protein
MQSQAFWDAQYEQIPSIDEELTHSRHLAVGGA